MLTPAVCSLIIAMKRTIGDHFDADTRHDSFKQTHAAVAMIEHQLVAEVRSSLQCERGLLGKRSIML
jgi:hypothetical protein